jgi:dCMP deaminase
VTLDHASDDIDWRPSVHQTLMNIAEIWAKRSTCRRTQVGAVLARDGRTLASGYNGVPAGMPHCHCLPAGDPNSRPCLDSVHAEANAIAFAARYGISTAGATLYVTVLPCKTCAALVVNSGIKLVIGRRTYRDPAGVELLEAAGVSVKVLP